METNIINQTQIFEQIAIPNKLLVTEIKYINGNISKMVTGIPKGVNWDEIQMGIKNSLGSQREIISSKSTLFIKEDNKFEPYIYYSEFVYSEENRHMQLSDCYFISNYGVS